MVFLFLALVALPLASSLCDNSSDCLSLLQFKNSVTDDPDGHLRGWNEGTSFCNWTGIRCHPQLKNRIVALELVNMGLQGTISPSLANLSLLTVLSLQDNRFYGEIPTVLGNLSNLAHMNMSGNNLQGQIPATLQGCHSLKMVDLTYNNLSGSIPDELGQLKNLTYLALSVNHLTGNIPESLSNLTELTDLELAVNYFSGKIPPALGALPKLEIMYFHTNCFTGRIPAALANCSALREITLSENTLTGEIPSELGSRLHNLQRLYFLENQLSGQIPVSLSNLSRLTLLDLSLNKLEGRVPLELGKLGKLQILYLHSNDLVSGSDNSSLRIITALTNCSLLQKLHLGSCLFTGNLPDSVGALSKDLYYFNLLNNKITGEIPSSIGNLSGLVHLTLWYNYLNGSIPATIGRLGQLQRLYIGRNKLQGHIPDSMGQMTNLGLLDLSNNSITGPIPSSLGNLSQLRYLYLSHNNLSGNIPMELTRCSLLMLLDLSFNKLQGPLPIEIGHLPNLALMLNLSNNHLEGELPASIDLETVQAIDMSENQFSGPIPSSIGSCISLEYLNLSNNMLVGSIPESLEQIRNLEIIDLSFNGLSGKVPIWIGKNKMLKNLNLSYNRLTGYVPNNGSFKNMGRSSLMGNSGLCGGSASMDLPPCILQDKKKKHKIEKWVYFLVASSIIFALLICAMVIVCVRQFLYKKENIRSVKPAFLAFPRMLGGQYLTQREIEIATGDFHEANLVGRGSFGSVYKASINSGKTLLAVKVLNQDSNKSSKNFEREFRILSKIKHRNLVRMVGAIWSADFRALIFQFIGNGNLGQHLYRDGAVRGQECRLTMRERMRIAIDVAHGLEYLHYGCSVRVIHCDLKPQNVLLDSDMVAYVADFGIAKLISSDNLNKDTTTTTAFLRGTVGYIPPEYGQSFEVSDKGDVYSFGVMVLEMVTRKRPTSDIFSDGSNLRNWVISSFPNQILDVVDISLKKEAYNKGGSNAEQKLEELCTHIFDICLMCTEENPQKRPSMSSVTRRLEKVWGEMEIET